MIKKLLGIACVFFLTACTGINSEKDPLSKVQSNSVITVGWGEMCSSHQNIRCDTGLRCKINVDSSDLSGICIDDVMDKDIKCPTTKSPVCGQRGREKNGYLNECEAKRHGAEVISIGLCKPDLKIFQNCEKQVHATGNCESVFTGYEFDGTTCQKIKIAGCDIETPFESLEGCQKKCE